MVKITESTIPIIANFISAKNPIKERETRMIIKNFNKMVVINMNEYYDGTKLLSMMDINGNKPELYMCTTNRTGGKTTYFGRLVVNKFLKRGEKFCLLYRFNYELDEIADKFFKDIKRRNKNG